VDRFLVAIEILRGLGDKRGEGAALGNLGEVYRVQGRLDEAIAVYQKALLIVRDIGDKANEGIVLGNLGNVFKTRGRLDKAIEHYHLAVSIQKEIGHKRNEGIFRGNLGDVLYELGRHEESQKALQEAISLCMDTFPLAAGAFRGSLALLLAERGQWEEAEVLLQSGEPQVEPNAEEHGKFLCKKGRIQLLGGHPGAARDLLVQAQATAADLNLGENSELVLTIAELERLLEDS